jgi:hypothetical protein
VNNTTEETFLPHPRAPLFKIGSRGTVLSRYGRVLSQHPDQSGYLRVAIIAPGFGHGMPVHRLVAETFLPNPQGLSDVNHINHVKTDNSVENLEWVTHKENMRKAREFHGGWRAGPAGRPVIATPADGRGAAQEWDSVNAWARATGNLAKAANVSRALKNGRAAYGFYWQLKPTA